ncbi:hypothetical protein ANN_00492 [Periplaneta americana]|uniref:C2H2-type domain-containing protein n=1 Tax=Periplaneta americana TaxID=6978 RepID=A0ABQ8TR25_PERAM|nr:hypothetical protein ANN_00492 [Periplaneta americana]
MDVIKDGDSNNISVTEPVKQVRSNIFSPLLDDKNEKKEEEKVGKSPLSSNIQKSDITSQKVLSELKREAENEKEKESSLGINPGEELVQVKREIEDEAYDVTLMHEEMNVEVTIEEGEEALERFRGITPGECLPVSRSGLGDFPGHPALSGCIFGKSYELPPFDSPRVSSCLHISYTKSRSSTGPTREDERRSFYNIAFHYFAGQDKLPSAGLPCRKHHIFFILQREGNVLAPLEGKAAVSPFFSFVLFIPGDISFLLILTASWKKYCEGNGNTSTENSNEDFNCTVCGRGFPRRKSLMRHTRLHNEENPFKCNTCGKACIKQGDLVRHLRLHTGEKPFKCEVCGKGFPERGQLIRHVRHHTKEKPFKCEFCGKGFSERGHLVSHIRIHTGSKPYKCEICEKAFAERGNLVKHVRCHTGEKPFKCDTCGRGFTARGSLVGHERIHTGAKPFKCDLCDKCFAERGNLVKHVRCHTGEKPSKCEICGKGFADRGHKEVELDALVTSSLKWGDVVATLCHSHQERPSIEFEWRLYELIGNDGTKFEEDVSHEPVLMTTLSCPVKEEDPLSLGEQLEDAQDEGIEKPSNIEYCENNNLQMTIKCEGGILKSLVPEIKTDNVDRDSLMEGSELSFSVVKREVKDEVSDTSEAQEEMKVVHPEEDVPSLEGSSKACSLSSRYSAVIKQGEMDNINTPECSTLGLVVDTAGLHWFKNNTEVYSVNVPQNGEQKPFVCMSDEISRGALISKQRMEIFFRFFSDPEYQVRVGKDIGIYLLYNNLPNSVQCCLQTYGKVKYLDKISEDFSEINIAKLE